MLTYIFFHYIKSRQRHLRTRPFLSLPGHRVAQSLEHRRETHKSCDPLSKSNHICSLSRTIVYSSSSPFAPHPSLLFQSPASGEHHVAKTEILLGVHAPVGHRDVCSPYTGCIVLWRVSGSDYRECNLFQYVIQVWSTIDDDFPCLMRYY